VKLLSEGGELAPMKVAPASKEDTTSKEETQAKLKDNSEVAVSHKEEEALDQAAQAAQGNDSATLSLKGQAEPAKGAPPSLFEAPNEASSADTARAEGERRDD